MLKKNPVLASMIGMLLAAPHYLTEAAAGGKRQSVCDKEFVENDDGSVTGEVRFKFSDGVEKTVNVFDLSTEMQRRLTVHGALQKIGDSYAGVKGDVGQAKTNVDSMIEQLKDGKWKGDRGEAGPRLGELAEAIARIKGVTVEISRAAVEKATDDMRKDWRSNAKVKAVIAQIRAENAAKELEVAGEGTLNVDLG
jgi:hypothetical protein